MAAYALTVGKDGPKMTKSVDASLSPSGAEIRRRAAAIDPVALVRTQESTTALAREFGVSRQTLYQALGRVRRLIQLRPSSLLVQE
jgi:hypothetical protein